MATQAPAPTPQIAVERLCYPFVPLNDTYGRYLQIYSGQVVSLEATEAVPANATTFPPPKALPGFAVYWTGHGWLVMRDLRVMNLVELKALTYGNLDDRLRMNTDSLSTGYTEAEKYTWASQEADALAYQATGRATYLLTQLAAANNYTLEILCVRILAKAEIYRQRYVDLLAVYQASQKKIDQVTRVEDLMPFTLESLHALMTPMAS